MKSISDPLGSAGRSARGQQIPHPHEVVRRSGEVQLLLDLPPPHVPCAAQARDRLAPADAFFHLLAGALAQPVALFRVTIGHAFACIDQRPVLLLTPAHPADRAGTHRGVRRDAAFFGFDHPRPAVVAIDRTHRIGQDKHVFAYRLIAKDTVEEKVLALQQTKRELADAILGQDNSVLRDLTREDLEALLG